MQVVALPVTLLVRNKNPIVSVIFCHVNRFLSHMCFNVAGFYLVLLDVVEEKDVKNLQNKLPTNNARIISSSIFLFPRSRVLKLGKLAFGAYIILSQKEVKSMAIVTILDKIFV